jgi:L,D-transpeptidase catalytic domain
MRTLASRAVFGALVALAVPPAAGAKSTAPFAQINSVLTGTTISLEDAGDLEILDRVVIRGRIPLPGRHQRVTITVLREGHKELRRRVRTNPLNGRYRMALRLRGCCSYVVEASHGRDVSAPLGFDVHPPSELTDPGQTLLFNQLLADNGYHMGSVSDEVDESTELGILALRKVLGLARTETYEPELFSDLLKGRARFVPEHTDQDRHVEVDLTRQVMALVENGKATDVFHISSGAYGTPPGEFSFYSRGPGYNEKGMYYSVYYDGNYATHGYYDVPTYPASHGCVRNPEPYSVFIYDWIELGDPMYIYY